MRPLFPPHARAPRAALALAIALLMATLALGCRSAGVGGVAGPRARAGAAGFDTGLYPGDAAMRAWAAESPYRWVGYYLAAPCHRDSSWVGTRQRLAAMGWSLAVIYVGQQTWDALPVQRDTVARADTAALPPAAAAAPSCSRELLTAEQGAREGADAVAKTARDGFARGTTIFLDLERMDSIPERMRSYYRGWVGAVARDGRFRPGFYAHGRNAAAVHVDLRALFAEHGVTGAPALWVSSPTSAFTLERRPADSGVAAATIWQGRINVRESWGGHTLPIDQNVADALP